VQHEDTEMTDSHTQPSSVDAELYTIRDIIADHITCEQDCCNYPSGCGCALTAARAIINRQALSAPRVEPVASAASPPHEVVIVPVEMTEDMMSAVRREIEGDASALYRSEPHSIRLFYAAALRASPPSQPDTTTLADEPVAFSQCEQCWQPATCKKYGCRALPPDAGSRKPALDMATVPHALVDALCEDADLEEAENEIDAKVRAAAIEECAKVLDNAAQDWHRIRDPGMANNAKSYAKQIRALAVPSTMRASPPLCSCKASQRDGQHMAWCPSLSSPNRGAAE
jgi:hypothetical protein